MVEKYSIAILAGGSSRRMGTGKAGLALAGKPLAARVAEALKPLTDDIFLAGGDVARLQQLGLPMRADQYKMQSSLVGVYSAIAAAGHSLCFVTACDMPFASAGLVRHLAEMAPGWDAVVPVSRRGPEPLFAFYRRSCLPAMRKSIEGNELSIRDALKRLRVRRAAAAELPRDLDLSRVFTNVNTKDDLDRAGLMIMSGPGARGQRRAEPPLVCFVGKKDSGKTTFLEKLVAHLTAGGNRVAFIKHDVHGIKLDREGSDTWRLSRAGASPAIIAAPGLIASFSKTFDTEADDSLNALVRGAGDGVDIVIAEGFKTSHADRIEISRQRRSPRLALPREDLAAVISDRADAAPGVPSFGLNDIEGVATFLKQRYGL